METTTDIATPNAAAAGTLLLTLDEAARELRCARRSIERQVARHRLDGYWHARVTMGRAPDGSTDRRHVQRRSKTGLRDALRELEHRRDTEGCPWLRHGDPTFGDWLEHWLDAVLPMTVRWKTLSTYRSQMRLHVVPALGGWARSSPSTWRSTTAGCRPTGTPPTPSGPCTASCDPR